MVSVQETPDHIAIAAQITDAPLGRASLSEKGTFIALSLQHAEAVAVERRVRIKAVQSNTSTST